MLFILVNDPLHALFLCLAGPTPFWARVLSFLTIFQGDVYSRVNNAGCYDILSGGASVTGYSVLKKARKVALASFYATAIQALIVTMGLEQYCNTLTNNMIDNFCADAFCLFNSLVARRLTLLLPKGKNPDMQVLRDKLVSIGSRTMF